MAITYTYTVSRRWREGKTRCAMGTLASSGAYAGTETVDAAKLGFPMGVIDEFRAQAPVGLLPEFTPSTKVLKWYHALAAHAHSLVFKASAAANAVTMAANSLRNASGGDLTVVGAGADGGIANSAAAAAAEYAGTPGFSAVPFFARGR